MSQGRPHDPNICGINADTDCDRCRPKTLEYGKRQHQLGKIEELTARLVKGGIDPEVMADLIWLRIAGAVDRKVESLVRQHLKATLADCSIVSVIRGIWEDTKPGELD